METLVFECRGCNKEITTESNVPNHRICTQIIDRYGRDLFVEIIHGACYRFTNKRTGKKLKKPILMHWNKLYINTQYEGEHCGINGSWRDSILEKEISDKNYTYTIENILTVINSISKTQYTGIAFTGLDRMQ